jgi:cytoskeleton protein RodZ
MSSETGSEARSGIGARLRAGRERLGLTVLQAAEKLHVDARVLESLEAERFDALGAPVFVRGHLRHYAELVGEPATQLLDLYGATTPPVQPDLTRLPRATLTPDPRKLVVPALVVLIGFAIVGMVWWVLQEVPGAAALGAPEAPRAVTEQPVLEGAVSTTAAAAADAQDAAGGVGASASDPAVTAAKASPPAAAAVGGEATSSRTPPAPTGTMQITLRFAADCWVEVYDADGGRLFYDIGSAGSTRRVRGTPPLRVLLGNAPGVSLDIDGKPATVPMGTLRNLTAQFVIDRSGRIVRARPGTDGHSGGRPERNADGG